MKPRMKCENKPATDVNSSKTPSPLSTKPKTDKSFGHKKKTTRKKLIASLIEAKNVLDRALVVENGSVDNQTKTMKKKLTIQEIFKKYSMEKVDETWTPLSTNVARELYQYAQNLHQNKDSSSLV